MHSGTILQNEWSTILQKEWSIHHLGFPPVPSTKLLKRHTGSSATILMNAITTWGAVLTLLQNGRPFWTDHSAEWSIHHLELLTYICHPTHDNVTREYSCRNS